MKKDWLDNINVDEVRDFFTENIVDEKSYVAEVHFVRSETRNNVVLVLTRNPLTKTSFTHFYDAYGVVYLDDEGIFTNKFKGKDMVGLEGWYNVVKNANEGKTINGDTYSDAFRKHHEGMINSCFTSDIEKLERELQTLKASRNSAYRKLSEILEMKESNINEL